MDCTVICWQSRGKVIRPWHEHDGTGGLTLNPVGKVVCYQLHSPTAFPPSPREMTMVLIE